MNSRLLFSLTLPLLLLSGTLALRSNYLHPDQQHNHSTDPCQHTPHPHRRSRPVNDASRSEINLDLALALKILRIELNLMVLLLALYLYKKRITEVVVMQVKRCPVISRIIRRDGLPV